MPSPRGTRPALLPPISDPFITTAAERKERPEPYHDLHKELHSDRTNGACPECEYTSGDCGSWFESDCTTTTESLASIRIRSWTTLFFVCLFVVSLVAGVKTVFTFRAEKAITRNTFMNPPVASQILSSGPNETVALGCFSPNEERKGRDPYMPGLFYQFSMLFSRADGVYAASLFCEEMVEKRKVLRSGTAGGVDMLEGTYETYSGSQKITARVQWDVGGIFDTNCKDAKGQLDFGNGKPRTSLQNDDAEAKANKSMKADDNHAVHAKCFQYLSQPVEFCDIPSSTARPFSTDKIKGGGSFFTDCAIWSVYLAPPGRRGTKDDEFLR